jgi:rSAM/selenodomain-associated transferase 1
MRVDRPIGTRTASRRAAAPFQCRLVVMAKVPAMGRVKTRLAKSIGAVEAVRFYRHTLAAVVGRVGHDPRWQTSLSIAPDRGISAPLWPRRVRRQPQGSGDLGRRMQRILDLPRPGPLIIVGTDIPAIQPRHIADAFRRLRRGDAVVGPALDGGYWLIGLKRAPRVLRPFASVRWSTATTLADTVANLAGRRVERAATLGDVDDRASFEACRGWFGRRIPQVGPRSD